MSRKSLLWIVLAVVGLSACGSGATGPLLSPREKILKDVVLKDGDLPADWVGSNTATPQHSAAASATTRELRQCLGQPLSDGDDPVYGGPTVTSPAGGQDSTAVTSIAYYRSDDATASGSIEASKTAAGRACYLTAVRAANARPDSVEVTEVPDLALTSSQYGFRTVWRSEGSSGTADQYLDTMGLSHGRYVVVLKVSSTGEAPSADLESDLLARLSERAATASRTGA